MIIQIRFKQELITLNLNLLALYFLANIMAEVQSVFTSNPDDPNKKTVIVRTFSIFIFY